MRTNDVENFRLLNNFECFGKLQEVIEKMSILTVILSRILVYYNKNFLRVDVEK